VSQGYWRKLTGGRVPPEKLVERPFELLLERGGNTNILRTFDLPAIRRHFPEYEKTIRTMLE
jgi:hypothetical protein